MKRFSSVPSILRPAVRLFDYIQYQYRLPSFRMLVNTLYCARNHHVTKQVPPAGCNRWWAVLARRVGVRNTSEYESALTRLSRA